MAQSEQIHKSAYAKVKDRAKARSAAIILAGQDIALLPKVADAARSTLTRRCAATSPFKGEERRAPLGLG